MLAVDLVLGLLGDIEIGVADLVEAAGDIAAADLHPHVADPLHQVELAVVQLVDHALGIVADGVEAVGDLLVALTDLHGGDLRADHVVECGGLRQRPADEDDLVLVEIGDLVEKAGDRLFARLLRPDPEFLDGAHRPVQILQRLFHDFGGHCDAFPQSWPNTTGIFPFPAAQHNSMLRPG